MTLFLGGGGDINDSTNIDKEFFNGITKNDKILYLPVACDFTTYENCFEWFYSLVLQYVNLPMNNITMLLENDVIPNFAEYKSIYIGGGNTYKLLNYISKNNLNSKFKEYINNGGKLFGGSAGAIIFGKSIETVIEEKETFPDNIALCWLGEYTIRCHYTNKDDQLFSNLSKKLQTPVIALPEDGGIIINDNLNKAHAIGKVFIFRNGIKELLNIFHLGG